MKSLILTSVFSLSLIASVNLDSLYKVKTDTKVLKSKTLAEKSKAVPTLVKVMKSSAYPEENRWLATFMLGKIMGKKSSKFISKFSSHKEWLMRLASLKALLALEEKQYKGIYARALKDKALVVKTQALENIRSMNLQTLAPYVWAMLYDKENYKGNEGTMKRSHLIRDVIKTVGDLKFAKAKEPLFKMIQSKKYQDIFPELDYALEKITSLKSPTDGINSKKHFWSRQALSSIKI